MDFEKVLIEKVYNCDKEVTMNNDGISNLSKIKKYISRLDKEDKSKNIDKQTKIKALIKKEIEALTKKEIKAYEWANLQKIISKAI